MGKKNQTTCYSSSATSVLSNPQAFATEETVNLAQDPVASECYHGIYIFISE